MREGWLYCRTMNSFRLLRLPPLPFARWLYRALSDQMAGRVQRHVATRYIDHASANTFAYQSIRASPEGDPDPARRQRPGIALRYSIRFVREDHYPLAAEVRRFEAYCSLLTSQNLP